MIDKHISIRPHAPYLGHAPAAKVEAEVESGVPYPLGATQLDKITNFAVFSYHATRVEVVLFDDSDLCEIVRTIELTSRSGPVWHGAVPRLPHGQRYGIRIDGPYEPARGHRFNANKVLLDPYARAIGRPIIWDDSLFGYEIGHQNEDLSFSKSDSAPFAPLAAIVDKDFDWQGDRMPGIPWEETIIYETHLKDLTKRHPDVPPELRGTYLGLASDPVIDHLKSLGITAVELLPVHSKVPNRYLLDKGLHNHWGYNTLGYFAPEPEYASGSGVDAVREFKQMVRRLHAEGIEVLLDVVYNHTGEGHQLGPTLSFRGLDNLAYYTENPADPQFLMNYTGTGNTLKCAEPYVVQLITDSLRYWVQEMHVDGFRFDLATTLLRTPYQVNFRSAVFAAIQQDPVLRRVKLIAEPWDLGPDGYQVGNFPAPWAEWNGRFRDTVRQYWRGSDGISGEFATRLSGSSDLYEASGRGPTASINFITAHDGFTLQDLVSYERKHNHANLEGNEDGGDHNFSRNFGVEGPTDDPDIVERREAAKRSLFASLMLSQGVPMMFAGDELSHTKGGNNNTYCQDNDLSWLQWKLDERQEAFLGFVKKIIALRKAHSSFRRTRFLTGVKDEFGFRDAIWLHPEGREMEDGDWNDEARHDFGLLLRADPTSNDDHNEHPSADDTFLLLFNADVSEEHFQLPRKVGPSEVSWELELDGGDNEARTYKAGTEVPVAPHSMLVLRATPRPQALP